MSIVRTLILAGLIGWVWAVSARAGSDDVAPTASRTVLDDLRKEARTLAPLVKSAAVQALLDATAELPEIQRRTIYRNKEAGVAYTPTEAAKLPPDERDACTKQEFDAQFYYYTAYGTPLIYSRPLDLYTTAVGTTDFAGQRIFDFGYGGIGHLRLLATLGADAVGVEIQPVFRALYSGSGDQGAIRGKNGRTGKLKVVHGHFPSDDAVRNAVGTGYDLVMSKNVLKRGYIHPAREVDARKLIDLGVDDVTFARALLDMLKPGGHVLIYNICPAQNPPDKPYIPWADGHCPFTRELLEKIGFEIVTWNREDQAAVLDYWFALGYDEGQSRAQLSQDLFAWYTVLRKPKM